MAAPRVMNAQQPAPTQAQAAAVAAPAIPIAAIEQAAAAQIAGTAPMPPMPPADAAATDPTSDQSNTPTFVIGVSGAGKSAQIAALALYVHKKYGKKLLLASFDGGGIPAVVQELIAVGIIVWWKPRTRDPYNNLRLAWDTIIKAFQGWYPMEVNPRTGVMKAGGKMMPPIATLYKVSCPQGHLVQLATRQKDIVAKACPACGSLTNAMNMQIETTSQQPAFFKDIGAVAVDSISQALSWGEDDLSERAGSSELGGMDGAIGGKIISGDQALGQTTMSHVGFVQQQAKSLCLMAGAIPNLVVPPVITGLTMVANTKDGDRVCGIQLSGKAKIADAPAWVGNCVEVEKIEAGKDNAGNPIYRHRMYLSQWKDDRGIVHLCKNRAAPGALPQWLQDPAATGNPQKDRELAFSECSLGRFFELLDASLIKGIGDKLAEYGGAMVANTTVVFDDPFAKMMDDAGIPPAANVAPGGAKPKVQAAPAPKIANAPVVQQAPPAPPKAAPKPAAAAPAAPVVAAPVAVPVAQPTVAAAQPAVASASTSLNPPAVPTPLIAAPPGSRPKPPQAAPKPATTP